MTDCIPGRFDYGGVVNKMPVFRHFCAICHGYPGLPGTSGFVGEFVVIMASIKVNFGMRSSPRLA
jgi:NADH-quinone oxidoreductase subunit M